MFFQIEQIHDTKKLNFLLTFKNHLHGCLLSYPHYKARFFNLKRATKKLGFGLFKKFQNPQKYFVRKFSPQVQILSVNIFLEFFNGWFPK